MRIAYMLASLGIGGAERQVVALAERMAERRHEVVLLVLRKPVAREWTTTVPVVRLEMTKTPAGIIKGLLRAKQFLRGFQPDLVHSHTFPANMTARLLRGIGAAPAVLSTIHNVYEGGRIRMLAYWLTDRWSVHSTMVSEAVAERYVAIGAVPEHKISVITNGIDVKRFSPDSASEASVRASMNAAGEFVWLAAGRITAAKDYSTLIRAFARVRATDTHAHLWIAGESTRGQEADLQALANQLCIARSVQWLGHRDDVADLLRAADAFVLSSAWEGMPLVVGEAMAMEKPVLPPTWAAYGNSWATTRES
jgi:glycosyltransferase involved in cell wall biosynthesis